MVFVSVTPLSQAGVDTFVESFSVPWSCGYGTDLKSIASFGASRQDQPFDPRQLSNPGNPWHEVTPIIYLADAHGRVLWHDNQARPRHLGKSSDVVQELLAEIERALGESGDGVTE